MPSGNVHRAATFAVTATYAYAVARLQAPPEMVVASAFGGLITLWVNPDLDLNRRPLRGSVEGLAWRFYWYPYSRLFKHRSFWSHFPLVGTLIRFAYLALPLGVCAAGAVPEAWSVVVLAMLGGMFVSDTVHWLLDRLF